MKINEFGKMHIPMKFTWEMTEKCNLNCKMCYSRDCNSDGKKELSTKQSIYLLNKLEKENVLYMFLDGGEPLLRPDFFELLPLITSRFCTWLSTNGTLIDMSVAKQIKKSHLNTVFVSLHGSNEKLHDFITGTEGAYNKTINGIDALKKEKVNTIVIGYNKGLKQKGIKNEILTNKEKAKINQSFVSIPLSRMINRIENKCEEHNINCIIINESYTSLSSFYDNDKIEKQETYSGKRIKRGLYLTKNKIEVNADVNASLNILRKSKPNDDEVIHYLRDRGLTIPKRLQVIL